LKKINILLKEGEDWIQENQGVERRRNIQPRTI
jgi:hypothetical protein